MMKKELQYYSIYCGYSTFKIYIEYDKRKLKKYLKKRYSQTYNINIKSIFIENITMNMLVMQDLLPRFLSDHDFIYLGIYFSFPKIQNNYVYGSALKYSDIPKNTLKIILEDF